MAMNPQAMALNERIAVENPAVLRMLAARGRAAFFPAEGILAQAADARSKAINATIGIALEEDGSPLRLDILDRQVALEPGEVFKYAPSFGKPELRVRWGEMIRAKNPSLSAALISQPVCTVALTHALSMCGHLFLDPGDRLILPDLYWGNYRLIFNAAFGAVLDTFPTFDGDGARAGFNVAGFRERLLAGPKGKRVVLLNFPNNPTGYTVTPDEAKGLAAACVEAAELGHDVVVIIDDAYFGLVYEDGVLLESIFPLLADAHPRLLAVKVDGATKEDYAWGLRVGFVTFAVAGGTAPLYDALESKLAGSIRGNVSNAPHISQSLLLKTYGDPLYATQKAEKYGVLRARFDRVCQILRDNPQYAESFTALPFNSGYFMCVRPTKANAEAVRQRLLNHYDTGVIATSGLIRVAFSSAPLAVLEALFANVDAACRDVG